MPSMCVVRNEIPRNIAIEMIPIIASVVEAFLAWGRRKAGTPFEIASTPVSAVAPDENAFRIVKIPTAATPVARSASGWISGGSTDTGQPCEHSRSPTPISVTMQRMKPYVGIAKRVPASFTPRRFARVTRITKNTDISTRYGDSDGIAEMIATTPATVETTTVIM